LVSSVGGVSSATGACFPLAGELCKLYANFTEKSPPPLSRNQKQSVFVMGQFYFTCEKIAKIEIKNQLNLSSQLDREKLVHFDTHSGEFLNAP